MSLSFVMRTMIAATALCIAPAIATAQAPQSKRCGDGTTSTRSYFACLGHGGVDTSHAAERPPAAAHHQAAAVQAGEPRSKAAKSRTHAKSKSSAHHARSDHHPVPSAKKKQEETHRGWLPWRHKKTDEHSAKKKPKKHEKSRLPVPERPNGQPR
jgi:hypothetical protein